MACNPDFRHSLYHEILYKYHILDVRNIDNPGFPPYYPSSFFETIKKIHKNFPATLSILSKRELYQILLEDVLKEEHHDGLRFVPCRAELANTENDWDSSWHRMRMKGLGPDNMSFLFKLLHQLLITQDRLSRINQSTSPNCKVPGCDMADSVAHAINLCPGNNGIGTKCLEAVGQFVPNLMAQNAVLLNFDIEPGLELPVTIFFAITWRYYWLCLLASKPPSLQHCIAELMAQMEDWRCA